MTLSRSYFEKVVCLCLLSGLPACGGTARQERDPLLALTEELEARGWSRIDLRWNVLVGSPVCSEARRIIVDRTGRFSLIRCGSRLARVGTLTQADREQLNPIANRALAGIQAGPSCDTSADLDRTSRLRMTLESGTDVDLYTGSATTDVGCYRSERTDVDTLIDFLETLADWYGGAPGG